MEGIIGGGGKKGGRKNKNKNDDTERKRSEGSKIVVSLVRIRGGINTKDKESVERMDKARARSMGRGKK